MSGRPRFDPSKMAGGAGRRGRSTKGRTAGPGGEGLAFGPAEAGTAASSPGEGGAAEGGAGDGAALRTPGDGPMTVSELASRLDRAVATLGPSLRVLGEVSGLSRRTHVYFDLKDASAKIGCAVFAGRVSRLSFEPRDGDRVIAHGRVEFYAPAGRVTLIVERLERAGEGELDRAFRELCAELRGLGWFAVERKRPLPTFARRVAVVTSRHAAAWQDVIDTARRRAPFVELVLCDAPVQGEGAAAALASRLRSVGAAAHGLGIDAILITRGGGSREDLWAFNDRELARAIIECPVPVVAAIGHETDTTIAELVADERCATPTQAAMRLTPDREELQRQVLSLGVRLARGARRELGAARQRVQRAAVGLELGTRLSDERLRAASAGKRLALGARASLLREAAHVDRLEARWQRARPGELWARRSERVALLGKQLDAAIGRRLTGDRLDRARLDLSRAARLLVSREAATLDGLERELWGVGPMRVLARGYTVTLDSAGAIVREASALAPGAELTTRFSDGQVRSRVVAADGGSSPGDRPDPPAHAAPARRGRAAQRGVSRAGQADGQRRQMDLFGGGV